jgi:hypothetical protein
MASTRRGVTLGADRRAANARIVSPRARPRRRRRAARADARARVTIARARRRASARDRFRARRRRDDDGSMDASSDRIANVGSSRARIFIHPPIRATSARDRPERVVKSAKTSLAACSLAMSRRAPSRRVTRRRRVDRENG